MRLFGKIFRAIMIPKWLMIASLMNLLLFTSIQENLGSLMVSLNLLKGKINSIGNIFHFLLRKMKLFIRHIRIRQRKLTRDFVLEINKSRVDRVSEVVFVGVVLDECLSWKPHDISLISNKISKSVGIIFKASFCLSKATLICNTVLLFGALHIQRILIVLSNFKNEWFAAYVDNHTMHILIRYLKN